MQQVYVLIIGEDQGSSVLQVAVSVTSWACMSCGQLNPGHGAVMERSVLQ